MLITVKITDIHKLSDNDTGYPNIGNIVKFNTMPIIIPIVVDVKLSINDCFLVCISNYPNKFKSFQYIFYFCFMRY